MGSLYLETNIKIETKVEIKIKTGTKFLFETEV
jgi:hypothetical protein